MEPEADFLASLKVGDEIDVDASGSVHPPGTILAGGAGWVAAAPESGRYRVTAEWDGKGIGIERVETP